MIACEPFTLIFEICYLDLFLYMHVSTFARIMVAGVYYAEIFVPADLYFFISNFFAYLPYAED